MKKLLFILLTILVSCAAPKDCCAQVDWCDSISYSVIPNTNGVFSVMIETTESLNNYCDTVDVSWGVCNMDFCFSGFGAFYSFPIIQTTDTVKVCYNAYITDTNWQTIQACYDVCEWIAYNGTEWVEMGSVVGIPEVLSNGQKINVTYDTYGRVVTNIKKNRVYIKNKNKFIKL